jgi:methyl-accepting chemotaxis protein
MRLLRDLSIGRKLGLSALVALLLLGAMFGSARTGLATLAAQQDRAARAFTAQRRIAAALQAGSEMAAIGRQMPAVQLQTRLAADLKRAGAATAAGQAALQAAMRVDLNPAMQGDLTAAASTLDRFDVVLRAAGAMRAKVLHTRGAGLIQARPAFDASLSAFAAELANGGVAVDVIPGMNDAPPGAASGTGPAGGSVAGGTGAASPATPAGPSPAVLARAGRRLDHYRILMGQVENTALLFLATGNFVAADNLSHVIAAADASMAALHASGIPPAMQSDAATVAMLGTGMARAAEATVQQTLALDHFIAGPLSLTERSMTASLHAASRTCDRQVAAARLAAARTAIAAQQRLGLIAAAIALVLALSGWLTARAIGRPMRAMTGAVQAMAGGTAAVAIGYAGRRDEIGRMAAALETLRSVVRDAFVKAEMIRQFPVGVMTAEPDGEFRITYVNPEAERLLDLARAHADVPAGELVGQSIDVFHHGPERHRGMIADPANLPHHARLTLGEEAFDLDVCAIRDRDGAYVGPMVTWHRVTEQVRLVSQFEGTVGAIARDVGERAVAMRESARSMGAAAGEAGGRTEAVAAASGQAAANVSAVAASAEELSASVAEISRQVADSARIAAQAVHEAEATDCSVTGLSEAAGRIGEVVRLISDIAGRTNLLALNATIEAARAGEAGKGFAVVASEVKTLATQTARATEDIGNQIAAMQGATNQAVEALRSIAGTIQQMNAIATTIAGAVEQQGAATQEIARAVQQAAAGTTEVSGHIAHVSQAVQQTGHEANAVQAAADELATQSARLTAETETFRTAIQNAA